MHSSDIGGVRCTLELTTPAAEFRNAMKDLKSRIRRDLTRCVSR
jgi:hypothetical protein